MNPELVTMLQLLNVLIIPITYGGIKYIVRIEKKLTKIETKLGIDDD